MYIIRGYFAPFHSQALYQTLTAVDVLRVCSAWLDLGYVWVRLDSARLREKKVAVSADTANMFVEQVKFAGRVAGSEIERRIPGRIACLEKWDKPRTVSDPRAFLVFPNYYQEFVCLYAHCAAPLYSMLQLSKSEERKGSYHPLHWTPERDTAFKDLKRELLKPLPLFLVNLDKPFVIRTDASNYALGAVYEQNGEKRNHYPVHSGPVSLPPCRGNHGPPR